jgi:hypothetical protein
MDEFKHYEGVRADSVSQKFGDLLEKHKKRLESEAFRSGADDEEFDELDRLCQDLVDHQTSATKIRAELQAHEVEQEQKNMHDDEVLLHAAHSGRHTPVETDEGDVQARRKRSRSDASGTSGSASNIDDAMSVYLRAQAQSVDDVNIKQRRLNIEERRLELEQARLVEERAARVARTEEDRAARAAATAATQAQQMQMLMMMENMAKVLGALAAQLGNKP